jgi:hypothetical protein
MRYKLTLLAVLVMIALGSHAKNNDLTISILPCWGDEVITLNESYENLDKSTFKCNTLKFYICGIRMSKQSKTKFKEKNSFHLIDLSKRESLSFILKNGNKKAYTNINFQLGVDSITNESGVKGGDLDPTKGMYWSWQSGFINFKLEGILNSVKSKKEIEYHLGGYQGQFNSVQNVQLEVKEKQKTIFIKFDLRKFLSKISINYVKKIMSPSLKAKDLSEIASKCFHIVYD